MRYWAFHQGQAHRQALRNIGTLDVVLRDSTGAIAYATSGEEYRSQMQEFHRIDQQIELKKRGPLFTWSLEDKAAVPRKLCRAPGRADDAGASWEIGVKALKEQRVDGRPAHRRTPYYFFVLPDEGWACRCAGTSDIQQ